MPADSRPRADTHMPTDTQIAWAAGLFEGEGCAFINGKWNQPVVQLSSTDRDIVETFAFIVGIGAIYKRDRKRQNKPIYQWQASKASDVVKVLELLMPYLHLRRADRAHEVIAVALTKRARGITDEQRETLYTLGLKERE